MEIKRGLQTFYRAFERFNELTGERFDQLQAPTHRRDPEAGGTPWLQEIAEHRLLFLDAMDDDFNTGGALGELFEIVHALNRFAHQTGLDPGQARPGVLDAYRAGMVVLKELSGILGLFRRPVESHTPKADTLTEPLLTLLVELRNRLRREKNFAMADEIRNRLNELGVTLEDKPDGTRGASPDSGFWRCPGSLGVGWERVRRDPEDLPFPRQSRPWSPIPTAPGASPKDSHPLLTTATSGFLRPADSASWARLAR